MTSKNTPDLNAHFSLRKRNVLPQGVVSTTALRYDVAVSGFQKCLRGRNIRELKRRVNHRLTDIQNASLCAMRLFVTSRMPLAVQCFCPDVSVACHPRPRPWIVWPIWWPNGSHWTSASSFSSSQRTFHFSWKRSSSTKLGFFQG